MTFFAFYARKRLKNMVFNDHRSSRRRIINWKIPYFSWNAQCEIERRCEGILLRKEFFVVLILALIGYFSLLALGSTLMRPATTESPPDFTLVVSGQELGYFEPCGCAEGQIGGFPRRDSMLLQLASGRKNLLRIANGNLISDAGRQSELKAEIGNGNGEKHRFKATYLALFIRRTQKDACNIQGAVPEVIYKFSVEDGDSHTSTRSLSQPYVLGALDVVCKYEVQAVTEFSFLSINGKQDGWDIQSTDAPGEDEFVACP